MCSVLCLFWLSYQYLPSDWLERLLWRRLIVARGSSPESPGRRVRMIFLVYSCFIVLLCICVVSCPYVIYFSTVMARYNLFVLKVPLNTTQTNKTLGPLWLQSLTLVFLHLISWLFSSGWLSGTSVIGRTRLQNDLNPTHSLTHSLILKQFRSVFGR